MTETKRASLEELLEFANKVREAGGGNPLDALMPAVPQDSSRCLIAKNLNFNCQVYTDSETDQWLMYMQDRETRDRIAKALGLKTKDVWRLKSDWNPEEGNPYSYRQEIEVYAVVLPDEIGQVAADFDNWYYATWEVFDEKTKEYATAINPEAKPEEIRNLKEFWPYIEASVKEAMENATFVNEKGEIVI